MTHQAPDDGRCQAANQTILIIDDDEIDRMACKRILSKSGFTASRVLEAGVGLQGVLSAQHEHPDIVLLDYRLPDADGIAILRQITSPEGALADEAPSVVMMTGAADIDVAVEAMRLGARDYLVKDAEKKYLELLPQVLDQVTEERSLRAKMRRAEEALRRANQELEQRVHERTAELFAEREQAIVTLASIADAVFVMDNEGRVRQMNPAAERMTGESSNALIGKHLTEHLTFLEAESRRPLAHAPGLLPEHRAHFPLILARRDGTELVVSPSGGQIRDDQGNASGVVTVFHDITREYARSHALMYQATHDALTDLPNRLLFTDRLSQSLNHADHNK